MLHLSPSGIPFQYSHPFNKDTFLKNWLCIKLIDEQDKELKNTIFGTSGLVIRKDVKYRLASISEEYNTSVDSKIQHINKNIVIYPTYHC